VRKTALLAALALLLPMPASAAALPAFGHNALRAEGLADFAVGLFDLEQMSQMRAGLYRARFRQDRVGSNGSYTNWAQLDNLARQASVRGVTLVPVLISVPGEAYYDAPKTPQAREEFATFAAAAVARYGPKGSFWSGCGCPKRSVQVWEVWNEANFSLYWNGTPSPTEFALLVQAVRAKIRNVDPTARIMLGGLGYAPSYDGVNSVEPNGYLRDVIGVIGPNGFDALALHSYHSTPERGVNTAIAGTIQTLKTYGGTNANGSPRHQVWVNEFGKLTRRDDPATPNVNEQTTSETSQLNWLNGLLDRLLPNRAAWNLGPVFWYAIRDSHIEIEDWNRLGLRRTTTEDTDGGAKPAWDAYASRSRSAAPVGLPTVR
jgi:polysaccharide biosynthesis protein PslG